MLDVLQVHIVSGGIVKYEEDFVGVRHLTACLSALLSASKCLA